MHDLWAASRVLIASQAKRGTPGPLLLIENRDRGQKGANHGRR